MNKIAILMAFLLSSSASAVGRIQNEDVKSLADIESANGSITGTLTISNACISSPSSLVGIAAGQYVYDSTNPTYISGGTIVVAIPGTCTSGQIQLSSTAVHGSTGDTITFGGQPSQLINTTKIWDVGNSQQLSTTISNFLPSQTGNAGKSLTTNGSVASWAFSSFTPFGQGTLSVFTTSGTFTTPSNSSTSTVYSYEVVGGGGGGGGATSGEWCGGGGSGGTGIGTFTGVAPSTGITITIGTGGGGGSNSGMAGTSGTASSIGSPVNVSCSGGIGGNVGFNGNVGPGGGGGTCTGASLNISGTSGENGAQQPGSSTTGFAGIGGAGPWGGSGQQQVSGQSSGASGTSFGAGGGGAIGVGSGGTGSGGVVLIWQLTP